MKQTIHALDFDGTITTRDTFLLFLRFVAGKRRFYSGMVRLLPIIAKWKLRLLSTQRAKEAVFAHFCAGMSLSDFNALCADFAKSHAALLRPLAVRAIQNAIANGETVLIVSASIENYIAPFFADYADNIIIEATRAEVGENGRLTGRFISENCKGAEKVRRILARFPERESYRLIAYGDSSGDRQMLRFADEAHYKPFCTKAAPREGSLGEKIRFLFVGAVAVAVQYASYRLLLRTANTTVAYTLAYLISLAVNFLLSTCFTFRVRPTLQRAIGFCLSHVINYTLQIALLHLFLAMRIPAKIAPIPVYAVCVPVNFLLVSFFLTKRR